MGQPDHQASVRSPQVFTFSPMLHGEAKTHTPLQTNTETMKLHASKIGTLLKAHFAYRLSVGLKPLDGFFEPITQVAAGLKAE